MRHLSEFVSISPEIFQPGQVLAANLHIFMPLNKNIIFFRRMGDVLSEEDYAKISTLPKNTLLVHRSEREAALSPLAQTMAKGLSDGNLRAPALRDGATNILQNINPANSVGLPPSGDVARQILSEVPKVVETVMRGMKDTPSLRTYEAVLKNAKSKGDNPILIHNQQVSALAVLIRLTVGPNPLLGERDNTSEKIASLGAAGLMHDLGLLDAPRMVAEKHLIGDDEYTVSEKIAYMRHVDRSEELAQAAKVEITEETLMTIGQHHENYDGTGFKGIQGKFIVYPARILRIADEIVSCINHPANTFGFREALGHLHFKERQAKSTLFDPDLMNLLGEVK